MNPAAAGIKSQRSISSEIIEEAVRCQFSFQRLDLIACIVTFSLYLLYLCGKLNGEEILACCVEGGDSVRQVLIYSGEDGYWVAECPSLPGCISQGKTREEAVVNIKEAVQDYIAVLEEDGLQVPEERFEAILVAV